MDMFGQIGARRGLQVAGGHLRRARKKPRRRSALSVAIRPLSTVGFQWQVGSLAMWDNRCAQHNPVNDYHGHRRLLHRITLEGDIPR